MKKSSRGFTLLELLVVIAVIGVLAAVIMASLNNARVKARNAKRLQTARQVITALNLYYSQYGRYPDPASDAGVNSCGGWDATVDGSFIPALATAGILPTINDNGYDTVCGNYAYYRYAAGQYNCPVSKGAFYVLGIVNMEGNTSASPGFSCTDRNWQSEFQWVTGGFEN